MNKILTTKTNKKTGAKTTKKIQRALTRYMKKHDYSYEDVAVKCGVSLSPIWRLHRMGSNVMASTAAKIVEGTNGEISLKDFA